MASLGRSAQPSNSAPEAFRHFLAVLGPDLETAGVEYEKVRRKLAMFFRNRGFEPFSADLADTTLDRVVSLYFADDKLSSVEPGTYALGVARFVALEQSRKELPTVPLMIDPAAPDPPALENDEVQRHLSGCLKLLSPGERDLVVRYYTDEKQARIGNRKAAAESMQKSAGALRIQLMRMRQKLKRCIEKKASLDPPRNTYR